MLLVPLKGLEIPLMVATRGILLAPAVAAAAPTEEIFVGDAPRLEAVKLSDTSSTSSRELSSFTVPAGLPAAADAKLEVELELLRTRRCVSPSLPTYDFDGIATAFSGRGAT